MTRIANFIDAGYLEQITRQYSAKRIDYQSLAREMSGDRDVLRTYYYDCLPYQDNPPSAEQHDRFARKHRFITALSHLPRYEVRLGQLESRVVDGRSVYHQKRVDVWQGVDMAVAAAKRLVTDVSLLAGDSDFVPAIETAKSEGVVIHLFYGPSAHGDLIRVCDDRVAITPEFLNSIAR